MQWKNGDSFVSRIYIAGHRGMVGSAIVRRLEARREQGESLELITRTHAEVNLTNQAAVRDFMQAEKPGAVILTAARVGGIHANNTCPADFIYDNLMIEANVIHQAFEAGVKRLLFLGSSCTYPRDADQPIHFLDNCSRLAGCRHMEHWLIRPDSPGQEHQPLLEHARRWPGAIYLNLGQDPGLYETWNLGCCLARGRYLSNANVDDVRHRDHVATLHALLEGAPAADAASAALRVTAVANQNWRDWRPGRMFYCDGQDDEVYPVSVLIRRGPNGALAPHNRPHCMPLWRRALHLFNSFFNEREYGPSADWEFWLRCGSAGSRFVRTPRPLGMYLEYSQSYWHREGDAGGYNQRILARYGALAREGRLPKAMHPPAWRDLSRFLSAGNWLGVMIALLRLHAQRPAGEKSNGSPVDRRARQLFGVELPNACERLRAVLSNASGTEMRLERLESVLVDLLRAFCAAQGDVAERSATMGGTAP